MRCDDLTAFLSQTGFFRRLALRAHLVHCARCRQHAAEWLCLSREISRLEGEPVPQALTERLMADAMTAAADVRSRLSSSSPNGMRTTEAKDMRRALSVAGFAAVLIAVGVWLLPRGNGNRALADVARAMASVKSLHVVGSRLDTKTGERRRFEMWQMGPDRYRSIEEGHVDQAIVGGKRTAIMYDLPEPRVQIDHVGRGEPSETLDIWRSEEAINEMIRNFGARVNQAGQKTVNGVATRLTELVIAESGKRPGGKILVYADSEANLIVKIEHYSSDGELLVSFDRFEYNMDFPDSVFSIRIPKGMPVEDHSRNPRSSGGGIGGG